jgi:general secretion pathway protein K
MRRALKPPMQRKFRGAALVIAMLLTALGAAVAAQLIAPLAGWIKRDYTSRDVQAAYTLADAATAWSLTVLAGDARLSQTDHYGELWATKLPVTQVEGGTIEGQIRDLQSRFNLNNLAPAGVKSPSSVTLAKALFASAKVPTSLVDTLADAIDRDDITDNGQSERQSYSSAFPNVPITRWSDLLSIPGFNESHIAALSEIADILPDAAPININTVDAKIFAIAFPQASKEALGNAIATRSTRPFNSVADLSAILGAPVPEGIFATTTRHFSMDATIRFEHAAHRLQLRVVRTQGSAPQVLSRTITNA